MRRSDQPKPIEKRRSVGRLSSAATLPLPVYREFVDMLFGMRLPIAGLGIVYAAVCVLAAYQHGPFFFATLGVLGVLATLLRLIILHAYSRVSPVDDRDTLRRWERRYAMGNYSSAVLLALLNLAALTIHDPLLHLITISLVFSFGAGVVSRISVRPVVCVMSLLLATVPTIVALVFHALSAHSNALHTEMYLVEALLVAMITGLSLQTVAHLYRSAVEHHTVRHDLAQLAKFDALTGLANRLLLHERFRGAIASAMHAKTRLAVHFLDLDGFKAINDQHGHPAGDILLEQVARRLETIVHAPDTVARLGGDEFVVLQTGLLHDDEAKMLAGRIIRQLSMPYEIDQKTLSVSASVGIAVAPQQGVELQRLLGHADAALYRAKAGGKARAILCTQEDVAEANLAA